MCSQKSFQLHDKKKNTKVAQNKWKNKVAAQFE